MATGSRDGHPMPVPCHTGLNLLLRASASPVVLIVWPPPLKYFSHPSLVIYSFATPPIKRKLVEQIGGGLLIANHLDQSLWWANQKHWVAIRSYLLHSFLQVHRAAAPFTSHGNLHNYAEPKPFSWAKPAAYVGFSSSNFTVQDHIPSTAGDALRQVFKELCRP
jgi:hypothetical protein